MRLPAPSTITIPVEAELNWMIIATTNPISSAPHDSAERHYIVDRSTIETRKEIGYDLEVCNPRQLVAHHHHAVEEKTESEYSLSDAALR